MLKDLFDGKFKAGLARVDMRELEEYGEQCDNLKLQITDSVSFHRNPSFLRIECSRKVFFEPESLFEVEVVYFVDHYLKADTSLDSFSDEQIERELFEDLEYYSQQKQGFMNRISLLISQITATFGGNPVVSPPYLCVKKKAEQTGEARRK